LTDNKWVQTAKLFPTDHFAYRQFGYSVSVNGNRLVVGAPFSNEFGAQSGAVYFFEYNGVNWIEKAKRMSPDAEPNEQFGKSVSLYGNRAIISCYQDKSGSEFKGAAYIFEHNGNNWLQKEKLIAANSESTKYFGKVVSISDDMVVIGYPNDDTYGNNSGAIYIFEYNGTNWIQKAKLFASMPEANSFFGVSVCIDQDRAIVGTSLYQNGAAYLIQKIGNDWVIIKRFDSLDINDPFNDYYFGQNVSIQGNDIVVNATFGYLFNFSDQKWNYVAKLIPSFNTNSNVVNNCIAMDDSLVIIGLTESVLSFNKRHTNMTENNLYDKSYIVYPNPSADFVNINFFDSVYYNLTIRDINSKLILRQTENFGQSKIDISSFKNGIYIVELSGDEVNYFIRFQKI